MAYFEDRALRTHHRAPIAPDYARVAGIALIFAVLAAAIVLFAPEAKPVPGVPDWHGNVAASATLG